MTKDAAPNYSDLILAARNIRQFIHPTPLFHSSILDESIGGHILFKAETFQRTGSFKFRGAFNKMRLLKARKTHTKIVSWSSGNHAQAVAAAANILGLHATIIMPTDAPTHLPTFFPTLHPSVNPTVRHGSCSSCSRLQIKFSKRV